MSRNTVYRAMKDGNLIHGLSIGEFMSTPFKELLVILSQMVSDVKDDRLLFSLTNALPSGNKLN